MRGGRSGEGKHALGNQVCKVNLRFKERRGRMKNEGKERREEREGEGRMGKNV